MEEVNKNTEVDDTDKKLHISDVSSSTDLNHKCSIEELNFFFSFLCGGKY